MSKRYGGSTGGISAVKCYQSHPPLKIGDYVVYGGSCSFPVTKDADVYVGLDFGMSPGKVAYPWNPGEEFLFKIPDMGVPPDAAEFIKLIDWLAVQLTAQKKIHIGCIGGHGRTGMVLAALVKKVLGEADAITYVRKNYCEKAVESASQVAFLQKHFGITEVEPAKGKHSWMEETVSTSDVGSGRRYSSKTPENPVVKFPKSPLNVRGTQTGRVPSSVSAPSMKLTSVAPQESPRTVWAQQILFDKHPQSAKIKNTQEGVPNGS